MPESLWNRIADLPLVVESHALERLAVSAGDNERVTTHVRLCGRGAAGLGEDVGLDHDAFVAASDSLALEGEWTLTSFIDHLGDVDLWPEPPEWEMARNWRRWAFESAALDLALRQAGLGLPEALGRTATPVRFVNSLGLGDPPEVAAIGRRLATRRCGSSSTRRPPGRPSSSTASPPPAPSTSSTSRAATACPSTTRPRSSRCTRACSRGSTG